MLARKNSQEILWYLPESIGKIIDNRYLPELEDLNYVFSIAEYCVLGKNFGIVAAHEEIYVANLQIKIELAHHFGHFQKSKLY